MGSGNRMNCWRFIMSPIEFQCARPPANLLTMSFCRQYWWHNARITAFREHVPLILLLNSQKQKTNINHQPRTTNVQNLNSNLFVFNFLFVTAVSTLFRCSKFFDYFVVGIVGIVMLSTNHFEVNNSGQYNVNIITLWPP